MSTELNAILAVGVSQTLLMVTLAGFLLAAQRGLRESLAEVAKSLAEVTKSLAKVRERVAKLEGLLEGLRDSITSRRPADAGRTDAA